jgi:hypothetical protein
MTLEEKRQDLQNYCDSQTMCIDGCMFSTDARPWCIKYNPWSMCDERVDQEWSRLPKPTNPYWDNISKIADKQRKKGLRDYGQGLEVNPAPILDRIQHIEEELVDALMYLEWLKESVDNG